MDYASIFTDEKLAEIFPPSKADDFFDALFGDSDDGAFDISLKFLSHNSKDSTLHFELQLAERPGKCLACNLTFGLPEVFSRHPVINIDRVVEKIDTLSNNATQCSDWQLGHTKTIRDDLHAIPLVVHITS